MTANILTHYITVNVLPLLLFLTVLYVLARKKKHLTILALLTTVAAVILPTLFTYTIPYNRPENPYSSYEDIKKAIEEESINSNRHQELLISSAIPTNRGLGRYVFTGSKTIFGTTGPHAVAKPKILINRLLNGYPYIYWPSELLRAHPGVLPNHDEKLNRFLSGKGFPKLGTVAKWAPEKIIKIVIHYKNFNAERDTLLRSELKAMTDNITAATGQEFYIIPGPIESWYINATHLNSADLIIQDNYNPVDYSFYPIDPRKGRDTVYVKPAINFYFGSAELNSLGQIDKAFCNIGRNEHKNDTYRFPNYARYCLLQSMGLFNIAPRLKDLDDYREPVNQEHCELEYELLNALYEDNIKVGMDKSALSRLSYPQLSEKLKQSICGTEE